MGTDLDPDNFVIDPAQLYEVTVRLWLTFAQEACEVGIVENIRVGDRMGNVIIAWLNAGKECTYETLLSPLGLFITERIIKLEAI